MTRYARLKCQIRRTNGEDVFNVFVIVVEGDYHIGPNLVLDSHMIIQGVGNFELRINGYWDQARGAVDSDNGSEMAESVPSPIVRWHRWEISGIGASEVGNCGIGGSEELIGRETRQLLDVADIHDGICRNGGMARSHNAVQVVDPIERSAQTIGTRRPCRRNLRVSLGIR